MESEFRLVNQRSRTIKRLARKAVESPVSDESIEVFQEALREAECLQIEESKKKKTVVICKYNVCIAKLGAGPENPSDIITQLEELLEEATKWEESLVPDIWQFVGRGYILVNEKDLALKALKTAKRYYRSVKEWQKVTAMKQLIKELEKNEKDIMTSLEEDIKDNLSRARNISEKDINEDAVIIVRELMKDTYDYFDRLLKDNPQEAKNKAKQLMDYTQYYEKSEWELNQKWKKENESEEACKVTSSVWCDIGLIYSQLQDYSRARKSFVQAEKITKAEDKGMRKESTSTGGACCCFEREMQIANNIAATWLLQKEFQEAVRVYEKYFPQKDEIKGKEREAQKEGERKTEKQEKKKDIKDIQNKDLLLNIYLNLAFCYLRLGNTDKAYTMYSMAFAVAEKLDDVHGLQKSLDGLMASFLTMKKSPNTLEWFKLDLGIVDSDRLSVYKDKATKAQKEINKRRQEEKDKPLQEKEDENKSDREAIKQNQDETTNGASTSKASTERVGANDTLITGPAKQTPQAGQTAHSMKSSGNIEESTGSGRRNDKTFIQNGDGQSGSSDRDINIKADCKTKGGKKKGKIQPGGKRKQSLLAN